VQTKHFDQLPLEEQAAIKAKAEAKLANRGREESQNEEEPQDDQRQKGERPAKRAKVTREQGEEPEGGMIRRTQVRGSWLFARKHVN